MDVESNFVCEGKGIKKNTSHCGFASPDVRIKKKRLFGFRDFPIGVGLPQTTSNQSIKDYTRLEFPESIHDSSPEEFKNPCKQKVESSNKAAELSETVVQAVAKMYPPGRKIPVRRCFPQGCEAKNPENNARVYNDFRTSKKVKSNDKAVERPEKGVQIVENMYPPWRRTSVIGHFPQGCVAKNCEINAGVSLVSADFRTEQKCDLSNKKAELPEKVVETATEIFPPRRRISATRCFPRGFASKVPQNNAGMMLISPNQRYEKRDKASELPDEVVQPAEKMEPPQRRISVTGCFPQGCSKKDPEINPGLLPISTVFRNEQKVEQSDRAAELPKSVAQTTKNTCSPQKAISITRCPDGCIPRYPHISERVSSLSSDVRPEPKVKVQLSDKAAELPLPISTDLRIFTDFRTERNVEKSDRVAELPEKVSQTMVKTYSPQKAISISRCHDGCVERNPQISAGVSPLSTDVRIEQKVKVELSDKAAELSLPISSNFKTEKKVELSDKNVELPEKVAQTAVKTYPPQSCVPENSQTNAGVTLTPSDFRTNQKVKLSDKADDLLKRVFQLEWEICTIQRGTSDTRCSPQGCVAKNPQINSEVAPTSAHFRTELQECYVQNTLVENDAEPTADNRHQMNLESTCKITKLQSNHDCFEAQREKLSKNDMEKGSHRLPSSRKKQTCHPQEKASIDSEKPSHRMTVMALMASSNYHSMLKKRVKRK